MTRNELFQFITENNLKEDVKKACGKPYNSVSTEELNKFVEAYKKQFEVKETPKTNHTSLNRDECFSVIKANQYEADIKALYGKPYNSVSTDKPNTYIKNKQIEQEIVEVDQSIAKEMNERKLSDKRNNNAIEKPSTPSNCIDTVARQCLKAVCQILNLPELSKRLD